ncbi:transposase, partial [Streptomyces verrucosisporus]|uniref:transposase n=1 Tax=Streptomyces verrucosisporus TaxID=1695161 RepID=UPI0019D312E6
GGTSTAAGGDVRNVIVTDTLGLSQAVHVAAVSVQDRDGARRPLLWARLDHPTVERVWADQGFGGRLVTWDGEILERTVEIVRKPPGRRGFQVQPKRRAVERAFAWITARRRLARDYGRDPAQSETMIRWAMTDVILRRLTRGRPATRPARRSLRRTTP